MKTPFCNRVPTDIRENLKWRAKVHRRTMEDVAFVEVMRNACAQDPIFFINGFGWTYDPRRKPFPKLPFILYDYQKSALLDIIDALGDHDLLIEKSRDMGASWLCVAAMTWPWLFLSMQSFLFVSRVEEYVDKSGNPKALFWKFDFLIDHIPVWLRPAGYREADHRRQMHAENPDNGSVIDGESTNKRVARGDRRTGILLDEFAAVEQGHSVLSATRDATPCRIFNSTPEGTNNAFYDMRETGIKKLRLHWSMHPLKAAGIYTTNESGNLKVIEPTSYPPTYQPILDGKLRSPWYDTECSRTANLQEIAQEIDIDYLGSGYQFFNPEKIQEAITRFARPPISIGDLEIDDTLAEPIKFVENGKGCLKLWCLLDGDGKPIISNKVSIGIDVSAGTGASNSCIIGYDNVTKEKIFEYASPYIRPEALAVLAVSIARWFKKENLVNPGGYQQSHVVSPYLIWESNGPGRQFGSRVMELGYWNMYLRKNDASIFGKVSDIPGFAATPDAKAALLGNYRSAVESGECINYSKEALDETLEYIYAPTGGIQHARSASKNDPSGAKANHGDRVMADALAWKMVGEIKVRPKEAKKPEVPVGCLAWRMKMREEEKNKSKINGGLGPGWG